MPMFVWSAGRGGTCRDSKMSARMVAPKSEDREEDRAGRLRVYFKATLRRLRRAERLYARRVKRAYMPHGEKNSICRARAAGAALCSIRAG